MAVRINELTKDASFNSDDYIMKDGSTNGTRLISVQNAADDLARKSTVGLRRPAAYDEATDVAGTDYIVTDDTSEPKRVTAQNAATSFAQLAQYDTAESVSDQDYILKIGSTGTVTKVEVEQAAADFAQLAGQVVGSEMVESAIAKGLADEALDQAINTIMPNTVAQLRTELSEGTAATEIVDGAFEASELQSTAVASTDQFIKWDPENEEFKRVTVENALEGAIDDAGLQTAIIDRSDQLLKWDPTAKEYKRVTIGNVVDGSIARGTNRTSPYNATDPIVMGSFLYNQDGSPNSASTYNVQLNKLMSGLTYIDSGSTSIIKYGTTSASDQIAYYKNRDGVWYRTSVGDLLNLLHSNVYTYSYTPTAYLTARKDMYVLISNDTPGLTYPGNVQKVTFETMFRSIANYVGEHIPLDTNAAADTVDGQLTKALTDLGILNDVVDPDPT